MPLPLLWIAGAAIAAVAWAASGDDEADNEPDDAEEEREREAKRDLKNRRRRTARWAKRSVRALADRYPASGRVPSGLTCAEYWRSEAAPAAGENLVGGLTGAVGGLTGAFKSDAETEAAPAAGQADRVEKALDMFLPKQGPSDAETEAAALLREEDELRAMKTFVAALRERARERQTRSQSAPPQGSAT